MAQKEKRGLFEKLFGDKKQTVPSQYTQLRLLNGYVPVFTDFGDDAYNSDVVRSAVNAIASNGAKLKPKHIRRVDGKIIPGNSALEQLLQTRPNPYMSAYDFYYKIITQVYMQNNAFIYVKTDGMGNIEAFYPVDFTYVELIETPDGTIYAKFYFLGGKVIALPYTELIHIRRFFYQNDFYGEISNKALIPTLELINTTNQGIINAVKSSAHLRGLLKFSQSMLKPEDLKKQKEAFITDYMNVDNNGGVAALDAKADYIELKGDPKYVDDKQMTLLRENVYRYYNINEAIVKSDYNEEQWNAFYESVIEPLAIQLSLEFTSKLFTDRERGFGNEIVFEANRLQYASAKTKIELINTLMPLGLLSINESREIFNLGPVEDGDKRLVSLNFVDASKANQYQLGVNDKDTIEEVSDDGKDEEGNSTGGNTESTE